MKKFIDAGFKLNKLIVFKNILSDEEKLLVLYLTNVRCVTLGHLVNIYGWTQKHKIEMIMSEIDDTFVSKKEFEGFVP